MKTNILKAITIILLFCGGLKAQTWSSWSNWKESDCYEGIDFRIKTSKTSSGKYEAYIQFKNRYSKNVFFYYDATAGSKTSKNNGVMMNANDTYQTYQGYYPSGNFRFKIYKLRFEGSTKQKPCDK